MKHHDDDVNERLGNALRSKFESSKEQPDPALKGVILSSIKHRNRYTFRAWTLILVISVFLFTERVGDHDLTSGKSLVLHGALKEGESKSIMAGQFSRKYRSRQTDNKTTNSNKLIKFVTTGRNMPVESTTQQKISQSPSDLHTQVDPITKDSPETEYKQQLAEANTFDTVRHSDLPEELDNILKKSVLPQFSLNNKTDSLSVLVQQKMEIDIPDQFLSKKTFTEVGLIHDLKVEEVTGSLTNEAVKKDQAKTWRFLAGFMPMNTFQVVKVSPQQSTNYQNFRFPSNLTSGKLAFKFQAGIERRTFQFLIHYAVVPQIYSYEVGTNDYRLDNSSKQYTIIRDGVRKYQHNTLHLIGGGFRKNIPIRHGAFKTYFMNLGLDFSRDLKAKQNVAWGTAGFGKEVMLNKHSSVLIGPYLEYSFSNLASSQPGFQLRPYQIGVCVNIKYWKTKAP